MGRRKAPMMTPDKVRGYLRDVAADLARVEEERKALRSLLSGYETWLRLHDPAMERNETRITYDPIARAAYVYLNDAPVLNTRTITDQVNVDLDADANAVGVELLFVDLPVVEILQAAGAAADGAREG